MKIITSSRSHKSSKSLLKQALQGVCFGLLALAACSASAGFYISGKSLREGNGNNFVMRGVNLPHAWYASNTNQALADISATGANTVRVVLSNGRLWSRTPESEVTSIISQAKARQLITVLEVHDTTGLGEQTAATLSEAVDYWIDIRNALIGQEDYVIINIGNEPFGNGQPASAWVNGHRDAITRLRNAGFDHTLMVDAANWGQDWENIMRSNAATVFNSDPERNVIFSVHMYEVYPNNSAVNSYMSAFNSLNLPLVVGEFAADHYGTYVDAASIMARAQQYGFGYLGWSWSGNSSNLASLDIVSNFNAGSLTTWGNLLINGSNGIRSTSHKASIFGGGSGGGSCNATSITPHLRVYTNTWGNWQQAANTSINSGNRVEFGPHPTSGGSWGWAGCGTSGTSRAQAVTLTSSCTATATYTNSCGASSTQSFNVTVNSSGGGGSTGGTCNWYGTSYPLCTGQTSGWGWENNRSCIGSATCNSQ